MAKGGFQRVSQLDPPGDIRPQLLGTTELPSTELAVHDDAEEEMALPTVGGPLILLPDCLDDCMQGILGACGPRTDHRMVSTVPMAHPRFVQREARDCRWWDWWALLCGHAAGSHAGGDLTATL